jgi:hypothetical protein
MRCIFQQSQARYCMNMHRAICCLFWLAAGLAAEEIHCPQTVSVRQVATDVPAGWTAGVGAAPVQLAGVTFFDGKPEEEASLVYDRRGPTRTGTSAVWTFQRSAHIWLSCNYAATSVVLSKPLPPVTQCTVFYRKDVTIAGLPEIEHIDCR